MTWEWSDISSSRKQNTTAFSSIRGRRCEGSHTGRQAPLLHVRFDKNKSGLAKVDMDTARPVCAHCWEQIPHVETGERVFCLAPVTGEKDGAGSWTIANAKDVTLFQRSVKGGRCEWVVV